MAVVESHLPQDRFFLGKNVHNKGVDPGIGDVW